ncbi:MAG: SGNH/GDSL hydrolase family protein [Usitatibacter sp.]
MEHILCVGDSLTFGARDEYRQSYPTELSRLFWERQGKTVYCHNHSLSDETSGQLAKRIYAYSRSCPQAKVALVLIGTNDTFLPQRPDIFRDNLRQIIAVLKLDRASIGIGMLPPVIGPGLPNYPRDAQKQVDEFNTIICEQAEADGLFVADFRGLGDFIIDTVHLNHAGYCKMAELWFEALQRHGVMP